MVTEVKILTVETNYSAKQVPFKTLLLADKAPGHSGTLMEMYNGSNIVSRAANTTSVLQLTYKESL